MGLSKTACWNRLRRLEEDGVIIGKFVTKSVFFKLTNCCFSNHGSPPLKEWVKQFQFLIDQYPEIIEAHRLTGEEADSQLKMVVPTSSHIKAQQALIERIEFNSMSTRISLSS